MKQDTSLFNATSCSMPLQNQLMPNLTVQDMSGKTARLWDWRQKSHVVLLHEPSGDAEILRRWGELVQKNTNLWTWLDIQFLRSAETPADLKTGVYLIDRYGQLIQHMPANEWGLEKIEQIYVYHEAARC